MDNKPERAQGFTIVELLIVIVVIGILASITIVAYQGVQSRASDTAVKSDMHNIAAALLAYQAFNGSFPTEVDLLAINTGGVAKIKVTKSAYDITTQALPPSDPSNRNILVCMRGGDDPRLGIAALSKSGNVILYTPEGIKENMQPWEGQQGKMCPRLGIDPDSDPDYVRSFGYERGGSTPAESGWKSWVKG